MANRNKRAVRAKKKAKEYKKTRQKIKEKSKKDKTIQLAPNPELIALFNTLPNPNMEIECLNHIYDYLITSGRNHEDIEAVIAIIFEMYTKWFK